MTPTPAPTPTPTPMMAPTLRAAIAARNAAEANALPDPPANWRTVIAELLADGCLTLDEAGDLRGWLAWRILPRRCWATIERILASQP